MTLRSLSDLVNDDVALVRRGRYLSTSFIVGIGEDDWLVTVENGKIADVTTPPPLMASSAFAIRASKSVWDAFWKPFPAPGYHDIFAMLPKGIATIDGTLLPLMQNLQYFKDIIAVMRDDKGDENGG